MASPDSPNEYPLELEPPDIVQWEQGNTGIPYIWSFAADRPGPHVMLSAVVHGNELCGAIAVDQLLQAGVRPLCGTLSLGFMNVAAFQAYDPSSPNASRFIDEDFNRLWSESVLDGTRDSLELRRAREVRPVIHEVDLLLDIHSMQHTALPIMMAGPVARGRALALQVGTPRTIITDAGHPQGKRMRDYAPFIDTDSNRNALLVECGQHWAASSAALALDSALRFLRISGAIDETFMPGHAMAALPANDCFEVTHVVIIETDEFEFAGNFLGGEILPEKGTLLARDGDVPIKTPYNDCMLIMPSKRLNSGQTAVRLARRTTPPQARHWMGYSKP